MRFASKSIEKPASQLKIKNNEFQKDLPEEEQESSKKKLTEHDIKLHIERIHQKSFDEENPHVKWLESFKRLRKILRKLCELLSAFSNILPA